MYRVSHPGEPYKVRHIHPLFTGDRVRHGSLVGFPTEPMTETGSRVTPDDDPSDDWDSA